jgi:undecaprenyl phosphate-alpha-L-ara4FN deformylase
MLLALKIDVDTLRGAREGAPRLVELLQRHDARATFLWALGPDRTGRAIRRAFRQGFASKAQRRNVVSHYGKRALLYGTVLPGPDLGRRARDAMRAVRDAGFECGVHGFDIAGWLAGVAEGDAQWTATEMQRAVERFGEVFGSPPTVQGAPGWQTNVHALRLTQRLGFDYCSDGRGFCPHLPVWNAELVRCPQLPTTLPTLDELIGCDGVDPTNVASHLLSITAEPAASHVYTVHADFEGGRLAPVFEQLLIGWKAQGWNLVALRTLYESVEPMALPRCEVGPGTVPGRRGALLVQGNEFLGGVDLREPADPRPAPASPLMETLDAREESH